VEVPGHPFWIAKDNRLIFNIAANNSQAVIIQTTPTVTFSPPMPFSRKGRNEPNPRTGRRNVDAFPDGRLIGVTLDVTDKGELKTTSNTASWSSSTGLPT